MTISLSIGLGDWAEMLVALNDTRMHAAIRVIARDGMMVRNFGESVKDWHVNGRQAAA